MDHGNNQSTNADFSVNFHGVAKESEAVGERLEKTIPVDLVLL